MHPTLDENCFKQVLFGMCHDNNIYAHVYTYNTTTGFTPYFLSSLTPFLSLSFSHTCSYKLQAINVSATSISISVTLLKPTGQSCVASIDLLQDQHSFILLSSVLLIEISEEEHLADVVIKVVTPPTVGQLLLEELGQSDVFSLMAVEAGDVEYVLNDSKLREESDSFQLQFTVGHGSSSVVDFEVCIKTLPYPSLVVNNLMESVEGGMGMLSPELLLATQSSSSESSPDELLYTVMHQPMHGLLINTSTDYTGSSLVSFTQRDIDEGHIGYLNTEGPNIVTLADGFSFMLSNLHYELQVEYSFSIQLVVTELKVVDKGFTVIENDSHIFTPEEFYAAAPPGYSIEIYIIDQPLDGDLKIQRDKAPLTIEHPQTLDLSDIQNGYLHYVHNGTKGQESAMDNFRFTFLGRPDLGSSLKFLDYYGMLNITIELVNDNTPREVRTITLDVVEGSTTPITTVNLLFTDDDAGYDTALLNYTITFPPLLGIICLTEEGCAANKSAHTWIQSDIYSVKLFYKHNKSIIQDPSITVISDAFVFTVSDGLNKKVHNVLVFLISKVVVQRISSDPVYVSEGNIAFISASNMLFTLNGGHNTQPEDYKYQMTKHPDRGSLVHFGSTAEEFTGKDVENAWLYYWHDGTNSLTDYFTFSVSVDGYEISSDTDYIVQIIINPDDDDSPFLVTKEPLLVTEGPTDFKHFSKDVLEAQDNDTDLVANIVYLVEQGPVSGAIQKRPNQTAAFKSNSVQSFTQEDINKKNVRYERTNISSLYDSFSFKIANFKNDELANTNPVLYSVDVVILPTELDIGFSNLTVPEGGKEYLTPSNFVILHPYLVNQDYVINIHDQPVHGTLDVDAPNPRKISTEDLKQHKVFYEHDGSENFDDYFTFVLESMGSFTTVKTFVINVEHVNDNYPAMQHNSLLKLYAGQTVLITPVILRAVDSDHPASTLTYTFTLTPEQQVDGHFSFVDTPNQTNLTFTQDDIDNGRIVFVDTHDYGGTRNLSFTLSDGDKEIQGVFVVMALEVCLGVELLKELTVSLGGSVVISNTTLSYVSNGPSGPEDITYTLSNANYGVLTRDGKAEPILSFTKAEVNKNSIRYHHVATDIWEVLDVVQLKGSTPLTLQDTHIELNVSIVLPSQPGSSFAADKDLFMSEGEARCLNLSVLDARNIRYHAWKSNQQLYSLEDTVLVYEIDTPPSYGDLLIDGVPSVASSNFTQQQLTNHLVCYSNDGTFEQSHDSVEYTVSVLASDGAFLVRINNTLVIHINLFNDEKPVLVPSSLLSLNVVLGFSAVITHSMLEVSDKDNLSQEIIFSVIESPANGFLLLGEGTNPVNSFTQADINAGHVMFIPKAPGNFTFSFNFTDQDSSIATGMNSLLYPPVTFAVSVAKHFLTLSTLGTLHYQQDQLGARLTPHVLDSETNGLPSETVFSVSRKPSYGQLLMAGQEVENFTQSDIDRRAVDYMYKLSSILVSNDSFEVSLANRNAHVEGNHTVEIVVLAKGKIPKSVALEPVMYQPLPTDLLNLTDYSLQIKKWPTIMITSKLLYGSVSLYFGMPENHFIKVTEFDYNDLEKQLVYYAWFPQQDGIEAGVKYYEVLKGEVMIEGLPPGQFSITLNLTAPFEAASVPTGSLTPSSTPTAEPASQSSSVEPTTSTFNYSLALPMMILGLVMGIMLCVIAGFCCCQYRKINHKLTGKGAGSILSFPTARSRVSSQHISPMRMGQSPVLVQATGSGVIRSNTPSSESSVASVEMMELSQLPYHHAQPAMTSHTMQSSGYSTAVNSAGATPFYEAEDSAQFSDEEYDNIHPTQSLHQASPLPSSLPWCRPSSISPGRMENQFFLRGTDQRASSPVRRLRAASPIRRNSKPYASMSRVAAGPPSTKAAREFVVDLPQSVAHALPHLRDSNSTLPCESSSESKMADDPPVVSHKPTALPVPSGDAPRLFRTTHPVLKNSEYWV